MESKQCSEGSGPEGGVWTWEEAVGGRDRAGVQTEVSHGTLPVFPSTTVQISATAKRKPEKPKRQLGKGSGFRV